MLILTLAEARARALDASHRLAEVRARAAAAGAVVDAREAADRPIVAAQAGYTRTNHVMPFLVPGPGGLPRVLYPDVPDNYRTRLDVQWPIYTGGRTDALVRAAQAEASAVKAETEVARADLRLEVTRAFWSVVTARAAVVVLEQALSRGPSRTSATRAPGWRPDWCRPTRWRPPRRRRLASACCSWRRAICETWRPPISARLVGAGASQQVEPRATLDEAAAPVPARDRLVAEARAQRGERMAIEQRVERRPGRAPGGRGHAPPPGGRGRRRGLRTAQPADLSASQRSGTTRGTPASR